MSSDTQETSIGDQRLAVEQYAAANGYTIVHEYADRGISGWKSKEQLAFQELIGAASGGAFKAVLCWDQDRFSRFDPLEANHYWYLLDRAGVLLATVAQGKLDWHDLGGWLSASVMQHDKAQYVRDLARNVARGQRRVRIQDRRCLGPPPTACFTGKISHAFGSDSTPDSSSVVAQKNAGDPSGSPAFDFYFRTPRD